MAIEGAHIIQAAAFLGAGLAMGLGAIGPGLGEGFVGGKACEAIGNRPDEAGLLTRTMLVGQAVSESTGIYSLVIALLLLFVL
ncbi:MAG: ATP synthase F0 subunit C [Thermodesulfobacteriota bacterium]